MNGTVSSQAPWLTVSAPVNADAVDAVEGALWLLGASAISLLDASGEAILEPAPGETPKWRECRLQALFDANQFSPTELLHNLNAAAPIDHGWELEELPDRDWARAWMQDWQPRCINDRLWIYPSHIDPPAAHHPVMRLDPGLAFGSGSHPTTAMCLEWLTRQSLTGQFLIDYGCGSGVLAIAALLLGAREALGIDRDEQALIASRENAARNAVQDRLSVATNVSNQQAPFIVANILAGTLIELAPLIASRQPATGRLALTGILESQVESVQEVYERWYRLDDASQTDEWVLLSGTRTDVDIN